MKEPPAWYVPKDEEDYYMQTGQLPKTLAAEADLSGVVVPKRLDDGTFVDAQGNVLMHDDMNEYFARLRAAPAKRPPPPAVLIANPPPPAAAGPIVSKLLVKEREEKFNQL